MRENTFNTWIPQDPSEVWRDIPDCDGRYQISDHGRVRVMFKSKSLKPGQILKGHTTNGYHYTHLSKNGKRIHVSTHRLVLLTFQPVEGWQDLDVNHKNGVRNDNRLENLEWLSHLENIRYSMHVLKTFKGFRPSDTPKAPYILKGHKKGEAQKAAKLDADKVREIRRLCDTGMKQCDIAAMFGVSNSVIGQIKKRTAWAHVE